MPRLRPLLLLLLALAFAHSAYAQVDEAEIRNLVNKLKGDVANEIKQGGGNPAIIPGLVPGGAAATPDPLGATSAQTSVNLDVPEVPGVLLHVRSRAGSPFPGPGEARGVVADPLSQQAWNEEVWNLEEGSKLMGTPPALPPCNVSRTLKQPTGAIPPDVTGDKLRFYESQLFLDQLFIRGEQPPPDSQKQFGALVTVRMVPSQDPGLAATTASGYGAECLPFRIRVTGKYMFKHLGDDALKSYDFDPNMTGQQLEPAPAVPTQ